MKLFEIIDFYKLYNKPETLPGYDRAYETIPELAWKKYACGKDGYIKSKFTKHELEELKKREHLWAQDPKFAYLYATIILKGRFPAGEDTIATNNYYKSMYVIDIKLDRSFWSKKEQGLIK